jgi:hypothetical protein
VVYDQLTGLFAFLERIFITLNAFASGRRIVVHQSTEAAVGFRIGEQLLIIAVENNDLHTGQRIEILHQLPQQGIIKI